MSYSTRSSHNFSKLLLFLKAAVWLWGLKTWLLLLWSLSFVILNQCCGLSSCGLWTPVTYNGVKDSNFLSCLRDSGDPCMHWPQCMLKSWQLFVVCSWTAEHWEREPQGKDLCYFWCCGSSSRPLLMLIFGIPRKWTGQKWATNFPTLWLAAGSLPVFCGLEAAAGAGFGASWVSGRNLKMEMC